MQTLMRDAIAVMRVSINGTMHRHTVRAGNAFVIATIRPTYQKKLPLPSPLHHGRR